MKVRTKSLFIISAVVILSIVMALVDSVLQPGYLIKSLIKIVLFLAFPLIFYFLSDSKAFLLTLFTPSKGSLLGALLIGGSIYALIIGVYFLLREHFDFSGITASLVGTAGVTAENFVFVALYISFFNSLLEEFFFRGFAFLTLKENSTRAFAYLFSALAFSLYHVGMTFGWLNIGLSALMFFGLFMGGLIFNYFNEKSKNVYTSWLIHMFANFSINTIGFILFDIF